MIVYLHGSIDKNPVAEHTLICAPAGHRPKEFEGNDWWDTSGDKKKPLEFKVKFFFGQAEVDDSLGKYLVGTGQAMKSRLVLPNAWNQ